MKRQFDNIAIGGAAGFILPIIVVIILFKFVYPVEYFDTYVKTLLIHVVAPRIISLAVIPNIAVFFLFANTNRLKSAKGVLGATILYGIAVFVLYLSS